MPSMIFGLLSVAFAYSLLQLGLAFELPEDSNHSGAECSVLARIIICIASFALGLGNVPSMQSELYPLAVWSLGSGVSDSFVMRLTFLPLTDAVSPS